MSIAIVLIHQNNSYYLPYSLSQVRSTNPEANIYLLGDRRNSHYREVVSANLFDYFDGAKKFEEVYKHLSTNPINYELFCFQRWFILRDFMIKNSMKKCFYMDSDLMVYTNIQEEQKKFEEYELTLSSSPESDSYSPHCMFINSIQALINVCNFSKELYEDSTLTKTLEHQYKRRVDSNLLGGACDMTMFREYYRLYPERIGFTSDVIAGTTYDHNINTDGGSYEMKNRRKNIFWEDNYPCCNNHKLNRVIKFKVLHFQGNAKHYMKAACKSDRYIGLDLTSHYYWLFLNFVEKQRKRAEKLLFFFR